MITRKRITKKRTKYSPIKTFKKPIKVSFRNKYGKKVSFTATKVVKKKVSKRRNKMTKYNIKSEARKVFEELDIIKSEDWVYSEKNQMKVYELIQLKRIADSLSKQNEV